ncbi:putative ATP-dependent RNA helicase dhr2 [Trapelia coarctata]|nr:putative ATP-dependent RNA helicase dhr2 [Trapelia coarctata]
MPERVHHRFDDVEPPTKKLKIDESVAVQKPQPKRTLAGQLPSRRLGRGEKPPLQKHPDFKVNNPRQHPLNPGLKDKANALLSFRKELPIWSHAQEIRDSLRSNDVMLLVGETGSGKSTQVPQFLIDEQWCRPQSVTITQDGATKTVKVGGCIAITEPRRVAAITLARRVAEEMGTPLGLSSPASKVGYSVRFDNSTSPSTRIKFLTEGMLLQEMLQDPWLRQYSAVIVDEVHERGVNVDLVMGFLRYMLAGKNEGRGGVPLKVAVMSATADLEGLSAFFADVDGLEQNRRPKEVTEEIASQQTGQKDGIARSSDSEWSGLLSSSDDAADHAASKARTLKGNVKPAVPHCITNGQANGVYSETYTKNSPHKALLTTRSATARSAHVSVCHIEGRQYPVQTIYSPEPVADFIDAALRTIFQIHYKEPLPGDILVFLTGQETVESLEELIKEYALGLGPEVPKLLVLPLFAALPQAAQHRVFQPTPSKTRKVILATNIAETSVTVSGVRFVVDCGKSKIKQFRIRLGLDSLLVKPISKSAAVQRKGRAGREAAGKCYRLYTEQDYDALSPANTPEILRCDLSQAILTIKARGIGDILNFPFLNRPPREALEKALMQLFQLGALTDIGAISDLGLQIAKLPLTAPLGRVLLAAALPEMDCLAEAIDIVSCLSVENIFLNITSEETKEKAEVARRALFRREGDHLTLLATVQAYAAETSDRKAWAARHFVSHRAMQAVMDVRKQLLLQCQHLKLLVDTTDEQSITTTADKAVSILKSFLKGFATNTARLFPDGSYKTILGNQTIAIHPSSGLFGKKVEAIMYNEFVFTNRSYARGVSAVQMDWIREVLGV